jgi:uncharacterized protein YgiB involved in biofilm formation
MKRSKTVALSLMSISAVFLQSCDDQEVEAQIFRDVGNCTQAGDLTEQQCVELHNAAVSDHLREAPRFSTREECIAEFGENQCQEQRAAGGGGIWMPLMMGFMASRALDSMSGNRRGTPLYRSGKDPGTLRTGGGYPVGSSYGAKTSLPEWATKPTRTRTQSVSRSGFGSRSSGWGG